MNYKSNKYRKCLQDWYQESISTQSWKRSDHLHIDYIAKEFQNKDVWFDASLLLFDDLIDIVDNTQYEVLLCISLAETTKKIDYNILSIDIISKSLHDIEPPSFYLFPKKYGNLKLTISSAKELDISSRYKYFFNEIENDGEFCSFVYLISS
jgi:hypothetical protein